MLKIRPMTFLLPGIFLLILGLGNVSIGIYKSNQYKKVIKDLTKFSDQETASMLINATPTTKIQITQKKQERFLDLIKKALVKKDFYEFFIKGGTMFIILSGICFLISIIIKINTKYRS